MASSRRPRMECIDDRAPPAVPSGSDRLPKASPAMGQRGCAPAAVDQGDDVVPDGDHRAFGCLPLLCTIFAERNGRGVSDPTRGTAKIFAPQRGTIKDVHVKEGE